MLDLFRPRINHAAIRNAVVDVFAPDQHGRVYIGQGSEVDLLEANLTRELESPRPVLTMNSCTSALDLALHLCDLTPKNDDPQHGMGTVITTPMTCTATNSPIVTRGGSIVWADIDPFTGLIDPASVATLVQEIVESQHYPPVAIMAVDWGGHLCDYAALRKAATYTDRRGQVRQVPIIQDAAHSYGATVGGKPFMATDQHGDYVCFSFQAIKTLTSGDGGALICPDQETTDRARLLRWYGLDRQGKADFRCLHRRAMVRMVSGPNMSISKIVNERIEGDVWAVDENSNVVPSKITGWHKSKRGDRRFVRLSVGERATIMTDDHEVLTPRGYVPAGRLESGQEVCAGYPEPWTTQRQVIVGSLLGDANLTVKKGGEGRAVLQEQHTSEQDEYTMLKARALRGLGTKVVRSNPSAALHRPNGATHYYTPSLPALGEMRVAFYDNGKKIVPKALLEAEWSSLLLACWFMDDGSTRVVNQRDGLVPFCQIATNGFSAEDVGWLAQFLEDRGFPCVANKGRLFFTKQGSAALVEAIAPHVPPSMRYKVAHRTEPRYDESTWGDGWSPVSPVTCVVEPYDSDDDTVYCITTEHGNFATTTATVHNCEQSIVEVGYKYHMNDISATIALANMDLTPDTLERARENATLYAGMLDNLAGVILHPVASDPSSGIIDNSAWWLFTLLVADRASFQSFMSDREIATSQVHARNDSHPAFIAAQDIGFTSPELPGVDFFAAHQVSIPVGWWLSERDVMHVVSSVRAWARDYGMVWPPANHYPYDRSPEGVRRMREYQGQVN